MAKVEPPSVAPPKRARRKPGGTSKPAPATSTATHGPAGVQGAAADRFSVRGALFEIMIVAVGVLLALLVDEARQSRERRQLATEALAAMQDELLTNRSRLFRKLGLLHRAYADLESDPSSAARLVAERRNQQMTLSDAAWVMTVETGALRLLEPAERTRYASVYTAKGTYYDILSEEMAHWSALAAYSADGESEQGIHERDKAVRLWKAYATRVTLGICISAARIEIALNSKLPRDRLWATCRAYRLTQPPEQMYQGFGVPTPRLRSFL